MTCRSICVVIAAALLSGCAAVTADQAARTDPELACSFRSATTCWTLTARFPLRRSPAPAPAPGEVLAPPPTVLATAADSLDRR